MSRAILSLASGLILIAFYFFLAGTPQLLAAESGPILAPGNPPLTRDVSDATAEVTFFLLEVVATGDGELGLERSLLDGWAESVAVEYRGFSAEEQQQLTIMPALRAALAEAWPDATESERETIRDAFRPLAQSWLGSMSCDAFVGLAEAGYVEATSAHVARYQKCEQGAAVAPQPAPTAVPTAAPRVASPTQSTESPTAAYQRASAGLTASHNMYVNMSNVLTQNHVGNMNAILNMGNNNYRYVYKP